MAEMARGWDETWPDYHAWPVRPILKLIYRVETIRETSFFALVYWLATAGIVILSAGLVFTLTEVLQESIFFIWVISFPLIFLLRLIADIDNPFGHADATSAEDVSIDLLVATVLRAGHPSQSVLLAAARRNVAVPILMKI